MNEDREIILPVVSVTVIVIMFCLVMLAKGAGTEHYKVSVIVSNSSSGRWIPFKAGLEQASKDYNVDLDYVYTDYIDNIYTEASLISDKITDGADGIIVDFCLSDGVEDIVSSISAKVPVECVVTDVAREVDVRGNCAAVVSNDYAIGQAIGNEIVIDNREEQKKINIGIIAANQNQYSMRDRLQGFKDAIKSVEANIIWTVTENRYIDEDIVKANEKKQADVIIGLDNNSLEAAVDYCASQKLDTVKIYGSGCSEKLVYYIESGKIDSMILPNEFSMGYQSMSDLAIKLQNRTSALVDREVGFSVVHRENLFGEENQQILFPIVQ